MENTLTKIQNIPLVKTADLHQESRGGSVFFGVGLMTSHQLGEALPFDILGLFFATELIRRVADLDMVFIILGDSHALSNNLFPLRRLIN